MKKDENMTFDLPHFSLDLNALNQFPKGKAADHGVFSQFEKMDSALRAKFESKSVGFYYYPSSLTVTDVEGIQSLATHIRKNYEGVLIFGIGGSFLGAAALQDALADKREVFSLHWVSNVDRSAIAEAERFAKSRRVAALLISKSGNTTETLSSFYHLSHFVDPKAIFAITDPASGELRRLSTEHQWQTLSVPPNIGGRFSVFSPVGLLPLALAGVDIVRLLKGATELTAYLDKKVPQENPAYLYALAQHLWDKEYKHPIQVLMPYESSLKRIGDWYVQLWAESIGKKQMGPTPLPALGTTDQHSMLQLFKEGPNDKIVGFIDVFGKTKTPVGQSVYCSKDFSFLTQHTFEEINHEACLATRRSLTNSKVPTYLVHFPEISPETMGSFLQFQMAACAFAGELYGIDAFNQPGVEEAKVLLRAAL